MGKSLRQILLATLVLTFIFGTVFVNANSVTINQTINLAPLENTTADGRVIWEQGVIEAKGMGIAPPNAVNAAQGKALARRAAVLDAQRNLLEQIKGVQISSDTSMNEYIIQSDVVRSSVRGMVNGAVVVRDVDRMNIDGTYIVIMQMPLHGNDGLSAVAFNAVRPVQIQPFPQPAPTPRPVVVENYTGLVIVAKNMGLKGAFSPRVYNESGEIIYGNKFIDPDFAISQGMVEYSTLNIASSGNSRAGSKPLIINAIKIADHGFNLVISNADAQKVLAAQAQSGFMKDCKVVFAKN